VGRDPDRFGEERMMLESPTPADAPALYPRRLEVRMLLDGRGLVRVDDDHLVYPDFDQACRFGSPLIRPELVYQTGYRC
jgi:hypothetical protein